MRLLLDENISPTIGSALARDGHDVVMASVVCPGVPDEEVVALAVDQGRVLVTEDKDFGALAVVAKMAPLGVVRLSLPRFDPIKKASRLVAVLASEDPIGNILVVEPTRTRSHSIL